MITTIGGLAQVLFSSRIILQWLISERKKKILTPVLFWELSLLASFLLFLYGYLRNDFAIMLGQTITYYIYIRNIQLQQHWKRIPFIARAFIVIFPVIICIVGYNNSKQDLYNLTHNADIAPWLFYLGIISQMLFTFRFIYQWIYSERIKESKLPLGFWLISWGGSFLILTYAVFRKDPVLFAGHIVGIVAYTRNIMLIKKHGDG